MLEWLQGRDSVHLYLKVCVKAVTVKGLYTSMLSGSVLKGSQGKDTIYIYDLVPKGAQEKRTEVLENKVDRM